MKAVCKGCGASRLPRPSSVVTSLPATDHIGVSQELTACSSMITVQAPHWPSPQPMRVAFSASVLRRTSSRVWSGSASTDVARPLRVKAISDGTRSLRFGARDLDDVGPLGDVVLQVLLELRHGHRHGNRALRRP